MEPESKEIPVGDISDKIKIEHADQGMLQVYTNHVTTNWTAHDVSIRFGEMHRLPEVTPSAVPTLRIEDHVSVTMAWSEAKALRDLLASIIFKFEKINGEINQPKIP